MAFTVGEKVLVFHLGNLYDAKILKVENERYFIHYQGWKDRWDEVSQRKKIFQKKKTKTFYFLCFCIRS